jgi:hypothetical protein
MDMPARTPEKLLKDHDAKGVLISRCRDKQGRSTIPCAYRWQFKVGAEPM